MRHYNCARVRDAKTSSAGVKSVNKTLSVLLALAVALSACAPAAAQPAAAGSQPRTLTVFAAASLTQAFSEIGAAFEAANPGVDVRFNFGGSQTLQAQIEGGAPADVFASASGTNMDTLVAEGLVAKSAPKLFAANKLEVILPTSNPANVRTLQDLAKPGLKLVLADPSVPVGKYARQVLEGLSKDPAYGSDFSSRVLGNVVSNESDVKQVVAKVELDEADAGIAYVTDAIAASELKVIEIPADFNVIAKYPIAALVKSSRPDLAAAFVDYVLSPVGQATLKKWGFGPVQ